MKIRIIIKNFLNSERKLKLGGLENYIDNLAFLLSNNGYDVIIYQCSENENIFNYRNYKIINVNTQKVKRLISYIDKNEHDYNQDILIFATDFLIVKNKFKKSIAIQHGVAWDITKNVLSSNFQNYLSIMKNTIRAIIKYRRFLLCNNIVCVDYNFINWYRTQVASINQKFFIIPNYSFIPETIDRNYHDFVSIIFARRLYDYRGTRLFTKAAQNILNKYKNVKITIAGTGPDEQYMKEKLAHDSRVTFTTFSSFESIKFHSDFDIAVVPSIGSEGTSLSLLEAMAAGCAVIATNVGGMTNVILNGYNGCLINPNQLELEKALNYLINNAEIRNTIAKKAHETVKMSFSFEKWSDAWLNVIRTINTNWRLCI